MQQPPYELVADLPALKATLAEKLEEYALEPGAKPLDLVLFKCVATMSCCLLHSMQERAAMLGRRAAHAAPGLSGLLAGWATSLR